MSFTYRASIAFGTTGLSPTVEVGVAGTYGAPVSLTESVSGSGTYEATVTVDVNYTLLYSDGQGNYSIETIPPWAAGGGGSAPTVQQIWDELVSGLTTVGSVGKSLADMMAAFSAMIENVGGERFTTHAMEQAPAGGSSGTGSGAYTCTFNVKDGVPVNLQNANIRIAQGIDILLGATDSSGNLTFHPNNLGAYAYVITRDGYQPTTGTIEVTTPSTANVNAVLTLNVATTPASSPKCNVTGDFKNPDDSLAANVLFRFTLMAPHPTRAGDYVIAGRTINVLTDINGHLAASLDRNDLMVPSTGRQWLVECDAVKISPLTFIVLTSGSFDLGAFLTA